MSQSTSRIAALPRILVEHLGPRYQVPRPYSRQRAIALAQIASDRHASKWRVRCVAADLLAGELLSLAPEDQAEHRWWFSMFGLLDSQTGELDADVLRQGYSTRALAPFIGEFRRRLAWSRVPAGASAAELLRRADQPHRLPLTRYLIAPEDAAAQILALCRVSEGSERDGVGGRTLYRRLPRYEAALVRALHLPNRVLWLGPRTPRRLGGLLEHPIGTAAMVIKPLLHQHMTGQLAWG